MNKTKLSYKFLTMVYLFRVCTYQDSQNGQNDQCLRLFKKKYNLKSHLFTHGEKQYSSVNSCNVCQEKFFEKRNLEAHYLRVHEGVSLIVFKKCNSIMDRIFSATVEIPLQISPTNRFNGKTPEIVFSDRIKCMTLMMEPEPDYQKTAGLVLGIVKNEDYDIPSRNLSPSNISRICVSYIKIMKDPLRSVTVQIIDSPHDGFGQGKTMDN